MKNLVNLTAEMLRPFVPQRWQGWATKTGNCVKICQIILCNKNATNIYSWQYKIITAPLLELLSITTLGFFPRDQAAFSLHFFPNQSKVLICPLPSDWNKYLFWVSVVTRYHFVKTEVELNLIFNWSFDPKVVVFSARLVKSAEKRHDSLQWTLQSFNSFCCTSTSQCPGGGNPTLRDELLHLTLLKKENILIPISVN